MSPKAETISIFFRDIESIADIREIEDLQIEVWGDDERDIVPLNQLVAARYVGGTLIGAFDGKKLVGFVYGFYGHLRGSVVHHSHMLAVLPAYRSHDVALRLKLAQRERVLADRIADRITWTFDPLQSLNAHFNFAKLGVVTDTYKVDVYGDAGTSFLHRNGTDRFFVTWLVESEWVRNRILKQSIPARSYTSALQLLGTSSSGLPERRANPDELSGADSVLIGIPANINEIEKSNFDVARLWREETRRAFSESLAQGFVVTEYFLENNDTGNYVLERKHIEDFR